MRDLRTREVAGGKAVKMWQVEMGTQVPLTPQLQPLATPLCAAKGMVDAAGGAREKRPSLTSLSSTASHELSWTRVSSVLLDRDSTDILTAVRITSMCPCSLSLSVSVSFTYTHHD